jgi:hypothetical protein
LVDAGLIALASVLGGLFLLDSLQTQPETNVVADVTVGALACAALPVRRRWPVALALALMPTIMFSAFAMGATAVAMSAVAVYRSWRSPPSC